MRLETRLLALTLLLLLPRCAEEHLEPVRAPLSASFLADALMPVGTELESIELGGLSAVSYSPRRETWIALSDARVSSRFFELEVELDGSVLRVTPRRAVPLMDAAGNRFAEDVLDPEGLAASPWGTLLVATEADLRDEPFEQAKLLEFDPEGRLLRSHELPQKFLVAGRPPERGLRHNLGLESLSLSPDGTRLFAGAEATLVQDGAVASFEGPGFCRIIAFRVAERELSPEAEYVYPIGPFAREPGFSEQEVSGGLVELVALSSERLLSLERIFIREVEGEGRDVTRARLFDVDLSEASDVSSLASLGEDGGFRPVTKELVLDLDDVLSWLSEEYPRLDNLEAMGLGPELPEGGRMLLFVSDDNFRRTQRTQFLLFRLEGL